MRITLFLTFLFFVIVAGLFYLTRTRTPYEERLQKCEALRKQRTDPLTGDFVFTYSDRVRMTMWGCL